MGNHPSSRKDTCSICGLDLIKGKCSAEKKYNPKNQNHYLIANIDGVRYWTDNIFWRDFFK
jgi:hypothetical protein